MRAGGADNGRNRAARAAALAVAGALVLASCQLGGDGGSTATGTPVAAESADPAAAVPLTAPTTWGDGLDHVLVRTEPAAAAPNTTPAVPGTAAPAEPAATEPAATEPAATGDAVLVARADGTTAEVNVPEGALHVVQPATDAERAAVAAATGAAVVVLVQDRDGVVGPAGTVYVMTPGRLAEVAEDDAAPVQALMSPRATPDTEPGISVAAAPADAPASGDPVLDALRAVDGVQSVERIDAEYVAVTTAGDRSALGTVPGVVDVADDVLLQLADEPRQYEQWWLQNLGQTGQTSGYPAVAGADSNALAGWQVSKGAGVVVAVIDTGVDIDHADLSSQIWSNPGESCGNGVDDDGNGLVDDCHGYDFGAGDANPRPDAGAQSTEHGTHVAGIVAAAQNGVGISGIAPQAQVMPVKVSTTSGALGLSAIMSGIRYASDEGAKVINLSLSTPPGTARSAVSGFETAVAYAQSKGVLVVAAAGNDAADIGARPAWPANYSLYYDNVITVGATTPSDGQASFSNYGAPVSIWAPGWFILSTVPNGGWNWLSGTSMAAPVMAGAAADIIASGQAVTPAAVRARVVERAKAIAPGRRLDLGASLGVGLPASVRVTYGGANALVADTDGTLGIDVAGSSLPAGTDRVRISVAASAAGNVYAVSGLPAVVRLPNGTTLPLTTGDDGSFAPVTLPDAGALAGGVHLDLVMSLPAGDFAVVTELLGADGTTVGSAQAGFFGVAGASAPPDTTPATTAAPVNPPDTAPATTAPTSAAPTTTAAGTGPLPTAPATTAPSGGGGSVGTLPTVPSTQAPGGGSGPITSQPVTSQPGTTSPATTQAPATTSAPRTTSPATSGPATTSPATTSPAPGTTAPRATNPPSSPTTAAPGTTSPATVPVTTVPATTVPATTVPATTTPAPPPDVSGPWRLDAASPRSGSTLGGDRITLTGRFPTTVPVYVWFGAGGIVQAPSVDGTSLQVTVPAALSAGVVDLSVRFTTSSASHVLTLTNAFTYVAPPGSAPGTTAPATTAPATSAPTNTSPATSAPTNTSPVTTAPPTPTSAPAATTTTLPRLGNLALRSRPTTGALSRLSTGSWSAVCRAASCPATSL